MKKNSLSNFETHSFIIPKSYSKGKQGIVTSIDNEEMKFLDERKHENHYKEENLNLKEEKCTNESQYFSNNNQNSNRNLIKCPGGDLDLSHYEFTPKDASHLTNVLNMELNKNLNPDAIEALVEEKEKVSKKKRIFRRPRKNSRLENIISFLEDRRIKEDNELYQLEDLKMPKLRKFLNIIFVTFGILFLLGVIIVILYSTFR